MKIIFDDGTEKDFGDEPVFPLRAQDELAPGIVVEYMLACHRAGLTKQAKQVDLAHREMRRWQLNNKGKVHLPDHQHRPVGE